MQKTATTKNNNPSNSNRYDTGPRFHFWGYVDLITTILLFLGSFNLGLMGMLDYDAVNDLLSSAGVRVFYVLVGFSSLTLLPHIYRMIFGRVTSIED